MWRQNPLHVGSKKPKTFYKAEHVNKGLLPKRSPQI